MRRFGPPRGRKFWGPTDDGATHAVEGLQVGSKRSTVRKWLPTGAATGWYWASALNVG